MIRNYGGHRVPEVGDAVEKEMNYHLFIFRDLRHVVRYFALGVLRVDFIG
jgi:hypothetical protein